MSSAEDFQTLKVNPAFGEAPRQTAADEFQIQLDRLSNLTDELEARLGTVLRSPHAAPDTQPQTEATSPLRGMAIELNARLDRLGYVVDRIDL